MNTARATATNTTSTAEMTTGVVTLRPHQAPSCPDGRGRHHPLHFSPHDIRKNPAVVAQSIKDALESGLSRPPLPIRTIPCPTSSLKIR